MDLYNLLTNTPLQIAESSSITARATAAAADRSLSTNHVRSLWPLIVVALFQMFRR